MATLLFQPPCCLPRCSPSSIAANASSSSSFRTTVRTSPPKSRGLAICRSSPDNGVGPEEGQYPIVFKDEANGIICYYDENGDLMCEGWDEGPHCQPDPQKPVLRRRRRFTPREMRARGMGEVVDFVNIKERMGESLQEIAKESFESSEL